MAYEFDDPFISNVRKGESGSPFKQFNEPLIVDNSGKVQLTEFPNRFHKVFVAGDNKDWYETEDDLPDEQSYKVDYVHKIVSFNIANIGKQLSFEYSGQGNSAIPATSIYTERDGLEVKETLQTLTDTTTDARNEVIKTNNEVKTAEQSRVQSENAREQSEQIRETEHGERIQNVDTMIEDTSYIEPFNVGTLYKKNNVVTFNGASFMAKKETQGNEPPNIDVAEDNEFWGVLTRKGADGTGTVKTPVDTFTATEGQKTFALTYLYDQFQGRTNVTVGGVPQRTPDHYEETTSNSITLKEGVPAGTIVEVKYFSESVPLQSDIQTTVDGHTTSISDHSVKINKHDADIVEQSIRIDGQKSRLDGHEESIVGINNNLTAQSNQIQDINNRWADNINENSAFDKPFPWYFAHRGAKNIYQEHTLASYENCLARGNRFIELDAQKIADGSLVIMHDSTMDRTTDGNWTLGTLSTGYISTKRVIDKVDNANTGFGYMPQPIPHLHDVLSKIGRKANYIIESKDRSSALDIALMVKTLKLEKFTIIQSFDLSDLLSAANQGIRLMYLSNSITDSDIITLRDNGVDFVGCNKNSSNEYVSSLVESGLHTFIYTVNNRFERDNFLNLGVQGFFSDDPFYLSEETPNVSTDRYREKVFMDGMVASYGTYRGKFNTSSLFPYTWGFMDSSESEDGRDFVLQGWAGKMANNFSIEFDINFGDFISGWGSIAFCTPVDYFDDNKTSLSSGYHLLITTGGNTTLYKANSGSAVEMDRRQGSIINSPVTKRVKVTVRSSDILIENITDSISYTVVDTEFRGGYISFGRRDSKVTFNNVTIN